MAWFEIVCVLVVDFSRCKRVRGVLGERYVVLVRGYCPAIVLQRHVLIVCDAYYHLSPLSGHEAYLSSVSMSMVINNCHRHMSNSIYIVRVAFIGPQDQQLHHLLLFRIVHGNLRITFAPTYDISGTETRPPPTFWSTMTSTTSRAS